MFIFYVKPSMYQLETSDSVITESEVFTITFRQPLRVGDRSYEYVITGVDSTDIDGAPLVGSFSTVGSVATLQYKVTLDDVLTTEGNETFRFSVPEVGLSVDVVFIDL